MRKQRELNLDVLHFIFCAFLGFLGGLLCCVSTNTQLRCASITYHTYT